MKMVKSLLLGTAAGLLAVAGAQAADMPVKAKPVEYVKICTLYGAGFYYIPGTDTCLKVGGYVRVQTDLHAGGGGIVDGSFQQAGQGRFTRDLDNDINYRVRGVVTLDARTQTEYGTLRSYIRAGWENTTPAATGGGTTAIPFWDRAFIQFAGFTVGRAQSFFDMFTYGGAYTYLNVRTAGDTGASGQNLWAYTVQFGNGVSYSLSLEDPVTRKAAVLDTTCANFIGDGGPLSDPAHVGGGTTTCGVAAGHFGFRVPDIITNLRVDQAWGYAGISTAIHEASGAYYGSRQQRQQRTSGRQVRLGVLGQRPVEPAGRRHHRRQLRLDQGRGRLCDQLGLVADVRQLQQPGDGVDFGWHLQHRNRRRADRSLERQCRLPARLGRGRHLRRQVADLGLRRLCQDQLQ